MVSESNNGLTINCVRITMNFLTTRNEEIVIFFYVSIYILSIQFNSQIQLTKDINANTRVNRLFVRKNVCQLDHNIIRN